MFGQLSLPTKQLSSLIIALVIGLSNGNNLNFFPSSGSGSFNGACNVIFEEYDNCDYYVATTNITCEELENDMHVDCSGCDCGVTSNKVDKDDTTTTTNADTSPTPTSNKLGEDDSATTTTSTTTTATTTTKSLSTTISPETTLESEAQKVASSLEKSFASEDFLQTVSNIPALSSVTKIAWISSEIITDSDEGDSVQAEDEVRMSCSITGYTVATFNEPQKNAFIAVIAEEANVPEKSVEILAVKSKSNSRHRRLRSVSSRRKLDSDEVVIDFSIQVQLQQEIDDEQQPVDSGHHTTTVVAIVATVAFVVVVAIVLVVIFVVVPRYRKNDSEPDADSTSYPNGETTLGSPKGIQMGAVIKRLNSNSTPLSQRGSDVSTFQFDAAEQKKLSTSPAAKMVAGVVSDALDRQVTQKFEQKSSKASASPNSTKSVVQFSEAAGTQKNTIVVKIPSAENLGPRSLSHSKLNLSYKVMPSVEAPGPNDDHDESAILSI